MSDIATLGYAVDLSGIRGLNKGLDSVGSNAEKNEKRVNNSAKGMSNSLGGVGKSAGQASIQVQQLVGQIQGGVNPMVALSQQAADLGFVLGAPLLGAVTAIGASLIGMSGAFFDASEEIGNTAENTDILIKRFDTLDETTKRLVKRQIELNNLTAGAEIVNTAVKLNEAREKLRELETDGPGLFDFGTEAELIRDARKQVNDLEVALAAAKARRIEYNEETDETLSEISEIEDLINAYELKAKAISMTDAEASLYIASQKLQVKEGSEQYKSLKRVIDAYHEEEERLERIKEKKSEEEKARKKAASALKREQEAYDRWVNTIITANEPIAQLEQEIMDIEAAMMSGHIAISTGTKAIADLNEQIEVLSVEPFSDMVSGASSALQGIQSLAEQGTEAYEDLTAAIYTASAAQALMSGNYVGAAVSGFQALDSIFGSELEDVSGTIQATQGLNKWNEKADSIASSTEMTANATEDLVGINTDMLKALTTLQSGITGAASIISGSTTYATPSTGVESNVLDYFGWRNFSDIFGQNIITEALDFLSMDWLFQSIGGLLGGSSKVSDEGIRIIGGTLQGLIDDTMVLGYQSVSYKKWRFGSTKSKTAYQDISDDVGAQFSLVFDSLADAVYEGATAIGLDTNAVTEAIQSFTIDTIDISLKGLSADEQASEIEAVFSNIFNDLASSVVPWLEDLQDAGEELGETLSRVATQVSIADYLVDVFGLTFGDKLADPQMYAMAADNLAELAGGVESLSDKTSSFISAFATDEQQLKILSDAMSESLSAVGLSLPGTSKAMYDLMSSLDGSTEVGQEQIATLLNITDTAESYYSILENTQESMADLSDTFASAIMDIYDVSDAVTQVSLDAALAAARLGDFSLAESLDASDYTLSQSDFASFAEFNAAQAQAANKLLELSQLSAAASGDVETQQLNELKAINANLTKALEESNTLLRQQNRYQAETSDSLDRINNNGVRIEA